MDSPDADRKELYRAVARIHAACINQGFLASLGERFLSLLYESIDSESSSVLLVKQEGGVVLGFVAGGCGMGPVYRQMLRRWPRLLIALSSALLNPMSVKRIIEIIWFSRRGKPVPECPKAELFSIAVQDDARGRGIAEFLYRDLAQWFSGQGGKSFCIVVGEGLAPAHRFYRRMGAFPMAEICVHQDNVSILYRQDLPLKI